MPESTLAAHQTRDPERVIDVRHPDFADLLRCLDRSITSHDDVITAHVLTVLSGVFPNGEEMFIDAVRHFRPAVTDPDLGRQVNSFIGQEILHGRNHRRLNDRFAELGYRSKIVEAAMEADEFSLTPGMRRVIWAASRFGPLKGLHEKLSQRHGEGADPLFRLAMTAALEHYTATMAEALLTESVLQSIFADAALFRFWAWHAIEESEHRAVAFDVYRLVGDESTRVEARKLAGMGLAFIVGWHAVAGILTDRRSWRGSGLMKSIWRNRNNPLLSRQFRAQIRDYDRPDFHPLDRDTSRLEAEWRAWFDDGGRRPATTTRRRPHRTGVPGSESRPVSSTLMPATPR